MAVARAAATWLVRAGSFELWLRKMRGFVPRIASAQTLIHHVIAEDLRRSLSRATRHLPHSLARHSRSTEVLDGLRVQEIQVRSERAQESSKSIPSLTLRGRTMNIRGMDGYSSYQEGSSAVDARRRRARTV